MIVEIQRKQIDNSYTSKNGGYITYFKLLLKMKKMYKGVKDNQSMIAIPTSHKFIFNLKMYLQFIFKPLLWFFITEEKIAGSYKIEKANGISRIAINDDLKRTWTLRLRSIYLFSYSRKATREDLIRRELIDKNITEKVKIW